MSEQPMEETTESPPAKQGFWRDWGWRFCLFFGILIGVAYFEGYIDALWNRVYHYRHPSFGEFNRRFDLGQYEEALAFVPELDEGYREREEYGRLCGRISECYRRTGDLKKALSYGQEVAARMPDRAEPEVSVALIYLQAGQIPAAMVHVDRALQLNPELPQALYVRSTALLQLALQSKRQPSILESGSPEDIVRGVVVNMEKLLETSPENLSYLVVLATAYGMLDRHDDAEKVLNRAAGLAPHDANVANLQKRVEAKESFWQ